MYELLLPYFILILIISYFTTGVLGIVLNFVISFIIACFFKTLYRKKIEKKVKKIKERYPNKTEQELIPIVTGKGESSILLASLLFVIWLFVVTGAQMYVKDHAKLIRDLIEEKHYMQEELENTLKKDTTFTLKKLQFIIPKNFVIDENDDFRKKFYLKNEDDFQECSVLVAEHNKSSSYFNSTIASILKTDIYQQKQVNQINVNYAKEIHAYVTYYRYAIDTEEELYEIQIETRVGYGVPLKGACQHVLNNFEQKLKMTK